MIKRFLCLVAFFIFVSSLANSQPPRIGSSAEGYSNKPELVGIPLEIENICTEFLKKTQNKKIKEGLDVLLKGSPIVDKKEQISNLIRSSEQSVEFYGEMMGFEVVNSEVVTESLLRVRYLSLHETFPMRWVFTFYLPPEEDWIVINVKLDDRSESFFSDEY